jgi:hypothetical protein
MISLKIESLNLSYTGKISSMIMMRIQKTAISPANGTNSSSMINKCFNNSQIIIEKTRPPI